MKYLKSFNESIGGDDLYRQLSGDESKYYLERTREVINHEEFLRLKDIQFNYYRDDNNIIVYKDGSVRYSFNYLNNPYRVNLPVTVIKIDDEWWVVIFIDNVGGFPEDSIWLCDTIDGIEKWFKDRYKKHFI